MTLEHDGDLTNPEELLHIQACMREETISLYTGDLGFYVDDYDHQEEIHAQAFWGQALCGVMILCPGGVMIVKHFTMFT